MYPLDKWLLAPSVNSTFIASNQLVIASTLIPWLLIGIGGQTLMFQTIRLKT